MGIFDKLKGLFSTKPKNYIPEYSREVTAYNRQDPLRPIHTNTTKKLYENMRNPNVLASRIGTNWMKKSLVTNTKDIINIKLETSKRVADKSIIEAEKIIKTIDELANKIGNKLNSLNASEKMEEKRKMAIEIVTNARNYANDSIQKGNEAMIEADRIGNTLSEIKANNSNIIYKNSKVYEEITRGVDMVNNIANDSEKYKNNAMEQVGILESLLVSISIPPNKPTNKPTNKPRRATIGGKSQKSQKSQKKQKKQKKNNKTYKRKQ